MGGHLGGPSQLERPEVIESRHATRLRYRIVNLARRSSPGKPSAVGRRLGPAAYLLLQSVRIAEAMSLELAEPPCEWKRQWLLS
jgi:hypothetical protein